MTSNLRINLLQSIADTIADYRQGEIAPITADHVDKWVSQFDEDEQIIILGEMNHLLGKYYISQQQAKEIISRMLKLLFAYYKKIGTNPTDSLAKTMFLRIQNKGNSQKELLDLVNEVLQAEYNLTLNQSGQSPLIYIYLDDCLFSGATAFYDLKARWLTQANDNTILGLVFFACYSNGYYYYIERKLNEEIKKSKKQIQVCKFVNKNYSFQNNPNQPANFSCLWPVKFQGDVCTEQYIQELLTYCETNNINNKLIFRDETIIQQEDFFSSNVNRKVVEYAFLKKGAYIISLSTKPKRGMRPMGYNYLESLGFGATFVTYRNIANNCPLVLWWGDPSYSQNHPFSKWYPLFPRKSNEETNLANIYQDLFG